MATQDDYIRTALRVPPELHAKIHESAKANNRTFNAEIVARLEGSFTSPQQFAGDIEMVVGVYLAALRNELSLLDMQGQLARIRIETLKQQVDTLSKETLVTKARISNMADAEIAQLEEKLVELKSLEDELSESMKELTNLRDRRIRLAKQVGELSEAAGDKANLLTQAHSRLSNTPSAH